MTRSLSLALLTGCASLQALPKDQPCLDAGYAISRRTFECTGDADLANARYELFRERFRCVPLPEYGVDTGVVTKFIAPDDPAYQSVSPPDFFHCAFAIEQLPCELVFEYGDDLHRWLDTSEACAWVVEPKEGG